MPSRGAVCRVDWDHVICCFKVQVGYESSGPQSCTLQAVSTTDASCMEHREGLMASLTLGGDWVLCDSNARAQSANLWSDSQHSEHKISAAAVLSLMSPVWRALLFSTL